MKHTISFIALSAAVLLSSCVTTVKTGRTAETSSSIKSATVADLKVTDHRISYTMSPSKEIQRAGLANVKQAAVQEALTQNGNADVMIEPEFVISMKNNFIFGKEVTSITVTGRPAYYQNFRTLHDSVWSSPGFYGQPNVVYVNKAPGGNNGYGAFGRGKSKGLGKFGLNNDDDTALRRTGATFLWDFFGGKEYTRVEFDGGDKYETEGKGFIGTLGTIGIQTTPHWFFGIGSGFMYGWDQKSQHVPLFGHIRWYFSKRKSSFFLDYKMGGSFEVGGKSNMGGVMVSGAVGYSFGSFEIALQSMNQYFKSQDNIKSAYLSRTGLSFGFKF